MSYFHGIAYGLPLAPDSSGGGGEAITNASVASNARTPGNLQTASNVPSLEGTSSMGIWAYAAAAEGAVGSIFSIDNGNNAVLQLWRELTEWEVWTIDGLQAVITSADDIWRAVVFVINEGALHWYMWESGGTEWVEDADLSNGNSDFEITAYILDAGFVDEQSPPTTRVTQFWAYNGVALSSAQAEAAIKTRDPSGSPTHLLRLNDASAAPVNLGSGADWTQVGALDTIESGPSELG